MLTFYHHPLSPLSRRVWIALLEKQLEFEPIVVKLQENQQYSDDFLALNPFHHVPVLVDEGFRLIESIAILDYLELQYPTPALMPTSPQAVARLKMIQMVTLNELIPKFLEFVNAEVSPVKETTLMQIRMALAFFEAELGNELFFGGASLSLSDIVLGLTVSNLVRLGLSLEDYQQLNRWQQDISARQSWLQTRPSDQDFQNWKRYVQLQIKKKMMALRTA